jgi:hypothetical protein
MPKHPSVKHILDDVLYLDIDIGNDAPVLQRIADCVRRTRPLIEECSREHGRATVMVALVAMVTTMAAGTDDSGEIAEAFRQHAELLDIRDDVGRPVGRA